MNLLPPNKIVLLGMMTKMPVAGVVWQYAHYLVGLRRLGYEVYYVEAHARTPSMFMETEKQRSMRTMQHAKVLKIIAALVAFGVILMVLLAAGYLVRKNPNLLHR